ncbi:MAG: hypothetical protein ACPL4K_05995, partial [Candidatus Margulisiibacteriota bacterium]
MIKILIERIPIKQFLGLVILLNCLTVVSVAEDLGDLLLKQGIGVRAAGMGGAYTAVANDASAIFYNPAGLAEPGFSYSYGSMDSNQQNNEYVFSLLKLGYLGYAEGKVNNPSGDQINFSAMGFSNRSGWFNWGANYKSLDWTVSGNSQSGWSADLALLARLTPQIKLGLLAQDILTTKERIVPSSARVGIAFKPFDGQLLLAADAEIFKSQKVFGHFGMELTP